MMSKCSLSIFIVFRCMPLFMQSYGKAFNETSDVNDQWLQSWEKLADAQCKESGKSIMARAFGQDGKNENGSTNKSDDAKNENKSKAEKEETNKKDDPKADGHQEGQSNGSAKCTFVSNLLGISACLFIAAFIY